MIYLIVILLISFVIFANPSETFESKEDIECYVITLKKPEKMKNIEKQQQKIPYNIGIVDAVFGDDLNMYDIVKNGIVSLDYSSNDKQRRRQIGCYMSHLKIMNMIKEKNTDKKYSIIFEDDFNISDNFMNQLNQNMDVLNNLDFDVVFLGNILEGHKGDNVGQNIFTKSEVYGTHGYLVNNKNVNRIIECMKVVDENIDLKYTRVPELKVYVMEPCIVKQLRNEFESEIMV